jgi:semaphorin 6
MASTVKSGLQQQPSTKMCWWWTIRLIAVLLVFVQGGQTSNDDKESFDPWKESDRPKVVVDYFNGPLRGDVVRFLGNQSAIDNFKLMETDGNFLLIGATNVVFFLDTRDMGEVKELSIVWHPNPSDYELCLLKGKSQAECQNHIRIVAKMSDEVLLLCGTHAYRPKCRHYAFKEGRYVMSKEFEGVGMTPYDPYHNSSFVVTDGELYTATVSDFSGSDPLIYKEPLRTDQFDSKHLNSPDFVNTLADGDYVYFFFREQAVEYINCGKSVYSRVARVCKNDKGGPNKYSKSWTTFLKSRLNCSLPGEYPFYFNHLQSTSDIVDGDYGGQNSKLIYAVFTTPRNSISANAICAFRVRDLLDTFEGAFKEQETSNSNWLPVPKIKEPVPRPGRCGMDSSKQPEASLSFVKGHSIMDEAVPSFFGGRPLFVSTNLQQPSQFRQMAVDPQVQSPGGHSFDVIYVGTTKGRILKIVNTADPSGGLDHRPVFIEELMLFSSSTPIDKIKVVRDEQGGRAKLVVLTKDQVVSVPLSRCSLVARSCGVCLALQDPYCAWSVHDGQCVSLENSDPDRLDSATYLQNVLTGKHEGCGHDSSLDVQSDLAHSGVHLFLASNEDKEFQLPASGPVVKAPNNGELADGNDPTSETGFVPGLTTTPLEHHHHYSAEELSMAVATSCVCALVIGFMTGFLLARRCSCSSRDEDNPYHVPYLNQLVFCLFFKIDQFNPPLMICPCTKTLENAPIKNMFS